mmetsp:Transcript_127441/g.231711  ORF Transcript_127441/g.231711 Transcript_127441/m.231711 type:complete len:452 (-) Transcript_127441:301-1656(-)
MFYPSVRSEPAVKQWNAEIKIEPEIFEALHRRGRRRLRDIQSASQATLKLDRRRGVLRIAGSKESISFVQKQLESVSGSHVAVTAPLWAELMRTRADADLSQAAVARIQHETGCRIHIERNAQEVQLFGPKPSRALAQLLLEELEHMCIEEVVDAMDIASLGLQKVQQIAEEFCVTLQTEESHISVMGIETAVVAAMREMQSNHHSDEQYIDVCVEGARPRDAACMAISEALSKLAVISSHLSPNSTQDSSALVEQNDTPPRTPEDAMQGSVTVQMPTPSSKAPMKQQVYAPKSTESQRAFEVCPRCGGGGNFCVHCGQPIGETWQCPLAVCPTCGVVKLCAYCGQLTEKMKMEGTDAMQQPVLDHAIYSYKPSTPMPSPEPPSMMPMPMQFVQHGVTDTRSSMPVAMCIPFDTSWQQRRPILPGILPNSLQAASPMLNNTANGIQTVWCQ